VRMRGKICTLNVEGQHRESWGTPLTNPHHRMPEVYPLRTMRSPRTKVSEDESRLANKAKPFIDDRLPASISTRATSKDSD